MTAQELDIEALARLTVDAAFLLHNDIGPGLLESAYETLLASELRNAGVPVETQRPVSISYRGQKIKDAFRVDLLVGGALVVEIKSLEKLLPVHHKQLLTYLRMTGAPLGLLINFGAERLKDGLKRVINDRSDYVGRYSRRPNQSPPSGQTPLRDLRPFGASGETE